jgi:hypothetical protein
MLGRRGISGIIRALAGAFLRLAEHTLGAVAESIQVVRPNAGE